MYFFSSSVMVQVYTDNDPAERQSWINYLKACIRHCPTGGVYNQHGELVSWHAWHLYGSGGLAHTLSNYKNHNLFSFASLYLTKLVDELDEAEKEKTVWFGYTALNNPSGLNIAKKLGRKRIGESGHRFYSPKLESKL